MAIQTSYLRTSPRAVAGLLADIGNAQDVVSAKVKSRRAVVTVTIPGTVDNSAVYSLSINGIVVSFTSDGTATQTELRDGLLAALNASPFVLAVCTPSSAAISSIVLTAKQRDFSLTVTSPSNATTTNDLTVTNTTLAGVAIPFGRFVKHGGVENGTLIADPLSASGDVCLGVSVHNHGQSVWPYVPATSEDTAGGFDNSGIPPGDIGGFIRRGRIWVQAEEALVITDTLYARYTATAANTTIGAIRNDADSSTALAIPATCKLLEYDAATGLAMLDVNC